MIEIVATGILAQGIPDTAQAMYTFPYLLSLADGTLLATVRAGSSKDSSDEVILFYRSEDGGQTWSEPWQPWAQVELHDLLGSLKICYLTELAPGRLLAASMWIDRTSYGDAPLFNAETEGCLPMEILLAESPDNGQSWSAWRHIPLPAEIGPASLTSPILKLADGTLALSIETNKQYLDASKWYQRVVFFLSDDEGQTWGPAIDIGRDPSGRIYNWDQRYGVAPDGQIAAFAWTYDSEVGHYLDIHRRLSADHGRTWSEPEALGITDQAGHPAILPDGRVVLPWVDRFQTQSICVRLAANVAAPFDPASEIVIYAQQAEQPQSDSPEESTGDLLAEMAVWSYGLPDAEVLPDGDVLVVYYAGDDETLDIHWVRLRIA